MDYYFYLYIVQILCVAVFRATNSGCSCYRIETVEKDLGTLSQTLLRKLLERSFLRTFKNFKQGDFRSLFFVCTDFGVAVFRATISGCSEPHSASEMRTAAATCCLAFSPLPDRNGRKLHLNRAERPVCRSVSGECNILMVADRKGKPQRKAIFAMFAQRTEGFPFGGRKLQAVCRVSD